MKQVFLWFLGSLLSLVCFTAIVIDVSSYLKGVSLYAITPSAFGMQLRMDLHFCNGRIALALGREYDSSHFFKPAYWYKTFGPGREMMADNSPSGWVRHGFYFTYVPDQCYPMIFVGTPLYAIILATGIPAYLCFRLPRRAPLRAGECQKCGYDLRATPERCPECGTEASVDAAKEVEVRR